MMANEWTMACSDINSAGVEIGVFEGGEFVVDRWEEQEARGGLAGFDESEQGIGTGGVASKGLGEGGLEAERGTLEDVAEAVEERGAVSGG